MKIAEPLKGKSFLHSLGRLRQFATS